jgi:hypothetical protein
MVIKWIKSVGQNPTPDAVRQAEEEERKKRRETKLVDVAHEAIRQSAAEDSQALEGLIRMGWPLVQRERFRGKVRKKVWDVVAKNGGSCDDEMIDEITERLVDVAESDPYYKKIFEGEEK